MSDELTPEVVAKLAKLARLTLSAPEQEKLASEVGKIIAYVHALQAVDTTGVAPTAHVLLDRLPTREDAAGESLGRDEVMGQAPRHDGEGFRVPTFVEE